MRVTDRRTDRQNYDSQDHASIAALRGKKVVMYQRGRTSEKWFLYNTNRKSHAAYKTVLLLITLSDLQGNVCFATF